MGILNRWEKRQLWRLEEGRRHGSKLDLWIICEGGGAAGLMVEGRIAKVWRSAASVDGVEQMLGIDNSDRC